MRACVTRSEKIRCVLALLEKNYTYDQRESVHAAARSADELVRGRILGDCTDYAVVGAALLRSAGVPARMVLATDANWIHAFARDPSVAPEGHAMLEVVGDQGRQWVNPSWGRIHEADETGGLPEGYVWSSAGQDCWDMGIRNVDDLRQMLLETARNAWREAGSVRLNASVPPD